MCDMKNAEWFLLLFYVYPHLISVEPLTTTSIFCEESTTYLGEHKLTWTRTPIGAPGYPNEFCSDENGIIPHRDCGGDYSSPGVWKEVIGNCSGTFPTSNVTDFLHRIMVTYAVNGSWNFESLTAISFRITEFTCIDLFLLSKALYYMTIEEYMYNLFDHFEKTLDNTLEIFSSLNERCQTFNASSYILGAVNVFFNRVTEEPNDLKRMVKPNFIFQITNPFEEGISGLGMYNYDLGDSFANYTIKEIFSNETYEDIPLDHLELAGYVPADLISSLSKSLSIEEKRQFKVIIVAFKNNRLFTLGEGNEVVSKVIGISIAGFCSKTCTGLFDIYSKPLLSGNSTIDKPGEWFTVLNEDIYAENMIIECIYPPVTYMFLYDKEKNTSCDEEKFFYAELTVQESQSSSLNLHNQNPLFDILSSLSISINYAQPQTVVEAIYKKHHFVLKSIMLLGCTLSLFGLLVTILTLIFIKNWYKRRMYTIQLEIAMACETFLFLIDNDISYITYIILYYFILSQFSWMMLIGYTQYLKFVRVFDHVSSNFLKSFMIGWISPALIIVIPICLHSECLFCEFCPAKGEILIYFVIIPTSLIILVNITIYLLVMVNICKSQRQKNNSGANKKMTRIGILLPFMLGITWIFVFALVSPWRWFSLAGSYLFHIIAPAQGFVLSVFVVALDRTTRNTWMEHWSSVKNRFSSKSSELSDKTESTQNDRPFTISR